MRMNENEAKDEEDSDQTAHNKNNQNNENVVNKRRIFALNCGKSVELFEVF